MSETVQAFTLYLLGTSILLRRNFARCMTVMAAGHRRKRTPVCGEEVPVRRSIHGTLGARRAAHVCEGPSAHSPSPCPRPRSP